MSGVGVEIVVKGTEGSGWICEVVDSDTDWKDQVDKGKMQNRNAAESRDNEHCQLYHRTAVIW